MKKKNLEKVFVTFRDIKTNLVNGRARNQFLKDILEHLRTFKKDTQDIIEKYADRDEEGKLKIDNGNYLFTQNEEQANKEFAILAEEEVELAKQPKRVINILKELTNKLELTFGEIEILDALFQELEENDSTTKSGDNKKK